MNSKTGEFAEQDGIQYVAFRKCTHNCKSEFIQLFEKVLSIKMMYAQWEKNTIISFFASTKRSPWHKQELESPNLIIKRYKNRSNVVMPLYN